jgi:hypothetical protein
MFSDANMILNACYKVDWNCFYTCQFAGLSNTLICLTYQLVQRWIGIFEKQTLCDVTTVKTVEIRLRMTNGNESLKGIIFTLFRDCSTYDKQSFTNPPSIFSFFIFYILFPFNNVFKFWLTFLKIGRRSCMTFLCVFILY